MSNANINDHILELLNLDHQDRKGNTFEGRSISSLMDHLRDRWKGLGNNNRFEDRLISMGYVIREGQEIRYGSPRGRWARIVTL